MLQKQRDADWARARLIMAMREVRQSLINPPKDRPIAEMLLREAPHNPKIRENLCKQNGELLSVSTLRGRVADLIEFAETQLGPRPPGLRNRSRRDRAIDLIVGRPAELAAHKPRRSRVAER
jgi:hypothetical protein